LPYHRMGQPKYSYLGMEYPYEGKALDKGVMERLRVLEREANERFKNAQELTPAVAEDSLLP